MRWRNEVVEHEVVQVGDKLKEIVLELSEVVSSDDELLVGALDWDAAVAW